MVADEGSLLELRAVSKRYRQGSHDVQALVEVDLEVAAGEFVAVVGPSGSGKSTLLHLAGGLDQPDGGVVRLGGRDLAGLSIGDRARLRRREIGFVFQFFHLIPTLTVAENVELPLLLDRRRATPGTVPALLDRLGIGHRAAHLPAELSGGEMQRTAIARALVSDPVLLLADEPTGNLDTATGAVILDALADAVAAAGAACVMVTHDASAAARADRVLHVRDGRIEASGATPSPPTSRPEAAAGDGQVLAVPTVAGDGHAATDAPGGKRGRRAPLRAPR